MGVRLDRSAALGTLEAFARAPGASPAERLPTAISSLLEASPFVYVSPLRSNAQESSCHAQLWYGWLDGTVVVNTAVDSWRSRCIARGLDRVRIWVGDHGDWQASRPAGAGFRSGARFDATAQVVTDPQLLQRLLSAFEARYPTTIARWHETLRRGVGDGSRALIRYTPDPATAQGAAAGVIPIGDARARAVRG